MKEREPAFAHIPRLRIFRSMSEYLHEMDRHIDEFIEKQQDLLAPLNNNQAVSQEIFDLAQNEYDLIARTYHRQFFYSFIMLVVATTECGLREIAQRFGAKRNSTTPLPGPKWDQLKAYVTKLGLLEPNAGQWQPVENLVKVRNCITHCGGNADRSRKPEFLKNFMRQDDELVVDAEQHLLYPKYDFCHRSLSWADNLLWTIQNSGEILYFEEDPHPINPLRQYP